MTESEPERRPEADVERDDEAYGLDSEVVSEVLEALEAEDAPRVLALVDDLHVADLADLIEQIGSADREALIRALGDGLDAEVISELDESVRDEVLDFVDPAVLAKAVKELNSDDVVYLVEDLEDAQKEKVLEALDPEERVVVEQSLAYPDYSAGRMMQRELVKAPPFWTVGQMIDSMRAAEELPDPFYEVIVVDPAMKPLGVIPLGRIMGSGRPTLLSAIMNEDFHAIPATQESDDVAYAFSQYHLVSAPVVDEDGRLVGVITIDDAVEAMGDEAEEDILRLGGVGDESLADRVWDITKSRFPWLAVNLLTAILASLVIDIFEAEIQAYVALAVLMPIVASMGGNAGTQTLTVAVRALATRDLTAANMWRVIGREALVGLINGVAFAVLVAIMGVIWFGDPMLGVVLAVAMIGNLLVAGLAGIAIPLALDRAGADPALASGTFVTTVTDVVGFFLFLGIGGWLLL
ncbi:MAG: magnesium transporter [Pikeienuella sp.]|uniref:magnesium transporter n=1 Tax=Pikeienuella sp. TaxID=2831957 RepID=UPI00391A4750